MTARSPQGPACVQTEATRSERIGVTRHHERGNHVRAALVRARTEGLAAGREELRPLAEDLARRFQWASAELFEPSLPVAPVPEADHLMPLLGGLLDEAGLSRLSLRLRVLFQLQSLCRDVHPEPVIDFVGPLRSGGRRPVERAQPWLQVSRFIQQLRRIVRRLDRRFFYPAARSLGETFDAWLEPAEAAWLVRLTRAATLALGETQLPTGDVAERAAVRAAASYIAQRILRQGHAGFGDLRDAVAGSDAKLPDVIGPLSWRRDDPLLRADAKLAADLDGIYSRGEVYLRSLHSLQALLFGTALGRALSRYLLFPFGTAFLLLEFVHHLLAVFGWHVPLVNWPTEVVVGAIAALVFNVAAVRAALLWPFRALGARIRSRRRLAGEEEARPGRMTSLLRGLSAWTEAAFRSLKDRLDVVGHRVDEAVRFRGYDRRHVRWVRAAIGLLWFFASYLFRFLFRLVVEPTINPIKHFPTVTVAGKISVASLLPIVSTQLVAVLPPSLAGPLAGLICVFMVPGFAGFLIWELKENWRLFAANRRPSLAVIRPGPGGETLERLLIPGVYSGVIPRAWEASQRDDAGGRAARRKLQQVRLALEHFVREQLVVPLREQGTAFGPVSITLEADRVELFERAQPLLTFVEHEGRLRRRLPPAEPNRMVRWARLGCSEQLGAQAAGAPAPLSWETYREGWRSGPRESLYPVV